MRLIGTKFHFIGIGGIGMCGLAELLHNLGAIVSGSDLRENKQVQQLKDMGVTIQFGHAAENISDADVVVYSSAVKKDNVEFVAARERKIPVIRRAEALAEIMRLKRGIAVGGTHGKTTTTSMLASIFLEAKQDPTIAVGGRLDLIQSTAKLGTGEWFIAEADESDGSFSLLSPEIVIVTNIDNDHMDHYKDFSSLQDAFFNFASSVPFYGTAVVCGDDLKTRKVFEDFPKKIVFYGTGEDNDYILRGEKSQYQIISKQSGKAICEFKLPVPGLHNALNATAALLAAIEANVPRDLVTRGVENFGGVDRRFQLKGQYNGAPVYDDYGHHPTEISAVLNAFREKYPDKKIVVAFQPHRYSRFQLCWDDFLNCFENCDELYVLPVYKAGEDPIDGISSAEFCRQIEKENCTHVETFEELQNTLKSELSGDDVFVTLGAGDVWKVGEELAQ